MPEMRDIVISKEFNSVFNLVSVRFSLAKVTGNEIVKVLPYFSELSIVICPFNKFTML